MSAARAAARTKPVVVVKAGRHAGRRCRETHTGALAGADRSTMLLPARWPLARFGSGRVICGQLKLWAKSNAFPGKDCDPDQRRRHRRSGRRPSHGLREASARGHGRAMAKLDAALPPIWSRANPVDIAGDADAPRYAAALEALLTDDENDAILVMNVATALASPRMLRGRRGMVRLHTERMLFSKPVFAVWVGDHGEASRNFGGGRHSALPIRIRCRSGYRHLVRHREALDPLMQTPPSLPQDFSPDAATARALSPAHWARASWLDPIEADGCSGHIQSRSRRSFPRHSGSGGPCSLPFLTTSWSL